VLSHPDVPAPIDVVWGNADGGLAHILARHPEVVGILPDRLAGMHVAELSKNRIQLTDGEHTAVVRLAHDSRAKTWLLTAFEGLPRSERGRTASSSELRGPLKSRAAPGESNMGGDTGGVETARDANADFRPFAAEPLPRSGRGSMGSPSELRGPLKSRAAPGEPNLSPESGSVETARDANANFRRLAADPLPHNEPEVVAASRTAAARSNSPPTYNQMEDPDEVWLQALISGLEERRTGGRQRGTARTAFPEPRRLARLQ
jgi:hypothetical protein